MINLNIIMKCSYINDCLTHNFYDYYGIEFIIILIVQHLLIIEIKYFSYMRFFILVNIIYYICQCVY